MNREDTEGTIRFGTTCHRARGANYGDVEALVVFRSTTSARHEALGGDPQGAELLDRGLELRRTAKVWKTTRGGLSSISVG